MKMTTMNNAERAGFEAVYGTIKPEDHATGDDRAIYELERMAFQAGAAWQRAQGAGVSEGWRSRLEEGLDEITGLSRHLRHGGCDSADLQGLEEGLTHAIDMAAEMLALLAAAPATPAAQGAVPEGWVIAPQEIHLSASDIELINGMCGDGNEESGYGPYQDGTLYIGYALQDDGSKVYGLHISCDECPEEGVATLAEFSAAPAHPAERQEQEDLHVWRATTRFGETCHFGEASTARAWAGENGTVERVELTPVPELRVVERHAELWAVHAQGPDDIYPAFDRNDAEHHAAELNAIQTPPGISVSAVVIPSLLEPAEHWKLLAEQERDHKKRLSASLVAAIAALAASTGQEVEK